MTPRFKRSLVMPFINTPRSERRARFHRHLHLPATRKTGSARMTLPSLQMGGQEPWGPSAAWPEVTRKCHTQAEVQAFSLLVRCAFHFSSGSPSVVQGTLGWGCPWDLSWESIFIIKLDLSAFSTFILSWVFNGVFQRLLDMGHWKRWDAEADTKIQLFYWARHEKACKNHRQLHSCHEFFYVRK